MKSIINFDTLEYMDVLKKSGMDQKQAEAITKSTVKALHEMLETSEITTKTDLINLKIELQAFIIKCVSTAILIIGGWQAIFSYIHQ